MIGEKYHIKRRLADPRFQAWLTRRQVELVSEGMARHEARRFAKLEAKGRARASLTCGIEQALAARLWMDASRPTGPAKLPTFGLIYEPA